jgi:hypothetical protein
MREAVPDSLAQIPSVLSSRHRTEIGTHRTSHKVDLHASTMSSRRPSPTSVLLFVVNVIYVAFSVVWITRGVPVHKALQDETVTHGPPPRMEGVPASPSATATATATATESEGNSPVASAGSTRRFDRGRRVGTVLVDFLDIGQGQRNFLDIGRRSGTDKVAGNAMLEACLEDPETCTSKSSITKDACRPWGHFYNTMYQQRLGPHSTPDTEPFQFLEIGFFNGKGYDTYKEFMPAAEAHSMEIACIAPGPREEGKWPWPNFASVHPNYQKYRDDHRLHCGDASDLEFLNQTWINEMKRPNAPPLKMVVDDGSHLAEHMAASMFFWFPRIQPRGLFIMEDIQPTSVADKFRTQFLPQIMSDLHFCGDPTWPDEPCFPTLQPLLASIHCEMHICIFERNDEPAIELDLVQSKMPSNALDLKMCKSLMR